MELIEDRHGRRSTIITLQLPVNVWYNVIGKKLLLMPSWTEWFMMPIEWILTETPCGETKNLESYSGIPILKYICI